MYRAEKDEVNMDEVKNDIELICSFRESYEVEKKNSIRFIFYEKSFAHIKALIQEFKKVAGIGLNEFLLPKYKSNDILIGAIILYVDNPQYFFALCLQQCFHVGKLFDEYSILLTIVVILRCEIDMRNIIEEFDRYNAANRAFESFSYMLHSSVKPGYYKAALLELLSYPPLDILEMNRKSSKSYDQQSRRYVLPDTPEKVVRIKSSTPELIRRHGTVHQSDTSLIALYRADVRFNQAVQKNEPSNLQSIAHGSGQSSEQSSERSTVL